MKEEINYLYMLLSVLESSKFTKHSSGYMGSNDVGVAPRMES